MVRQWRGQIGPPRGRRHTTGLAAGEEAAICADPAAAVADQAAARWEARNGAGGRRRSRYKTTRRRRPMRIRQLPGAANVDATGQPGDGDSATNGQERGGGAGRRQRSEG
ncbi:hypothetical protein BS78_01G251100 [Paspalum vaginatum]|nr:hypothetical protein BS78_01G251100 [Paspalum vaginatum]